jgi:hypothetical protein
MKTRRQGMKENKDQQSRAGTCFEEAPCAEMMEKILGEQGIGSLSEEMMRTWAERCREGRKEPQEAPKKEDLGNENSNGGVK